MKLITLVLAFIIASFFGCTKTKTPDESIPVPTQTANDPVVVLTANAVSKFREFLQDSPDSYIRVSISGSGCDGFNYGLRLDDSPIASDDRVDRSNGFAVVVAPRDSMFVEGTKIDWLSEPDGSAGFHFDNPNAKENPQ